MGDKMIHFCKICGYKSTSRKEIRNHIKNEHKIVYRGLADEKHLAKLRTGTFRHFAPLSSKVVSFDESTQRFFAWDTNLNNKVVHTLKDGKLNSIITDHAFAFVGKF